MEHSVIRFPSIQHRQECRGTALIIVLSLLVLLVALTLAFFSSVTRDVGSSAAFSSGLTVQKLADTAVNLAAAQIRYATRGRDNSGNDLAWASQPGAIRTFTTSGGEGTIFKLYSAQNMVIDGNTFRTDLIAEAAANATASPALFTDLNAPVLTADTDGGITLGNDKYRAAYPIFDPGALGSVEGLSIGGSTTPPVPGYNPGVSGNTAPMPVRWLYVLDDGSVVNPVATGNGKIVSVPGATATNSVVGRVAFWTDDDTSKVNINTAGDSEFWETPHFEGTTERNLALYQPANNEFQRYPGHPATVSLSAVFPTVSSPNLIDLAPRLNNGGSKFATVIPTKAVDLKYERLYSTVDELLYAPTRASNSAGLTANAIRQAQFTLTANSRAPETTLFGTPRVSIWPINADLAANPSSPYTTAFDRLSAFCATIGGNPFYFQRSVNTSTSEITSIPRNNLLMTYLQNLTGRPVPGFGGNFLAKYGDDRDQILAEIFDYIRMVNPFDDNLGGAGTAATNYATTGARYGFTSGRSSITSYQPGHGQIVPTKLSTTARGFGRMDTISEAALHLICNGDGTLPANPANPTPAEALVTSSARKETASPMQAFLTSLAATRGTPANQPVLQPNERVLQIAFYLEMTSVAQNYDGLKSDYTFEVSGLPNLTVTGTPSAPFPSNTDEKFYANNIAVWHARLFGTVNSHRMTMGKHLPPAWANNSNYTGNPSASSTASAYPFVSAPFLVTLGPTATVDLSAFTVTVKIYPGDTTVSSNPPPPVQTVKLSFPAVKIPVPLLPTSDIAAGGSAGSNWPNLVAKDWWGFRNRFYYSNLDPGFGYGAERGGCVLRRQYDVVRTLVPRWGDLRLIAGLEDVPEGYFVPHPEYSSTTRRNVNVLSEGTGSNFTSDQDLSGPSYNATTDLRRLVSSANYDAGRRPDIPPDPAATAFSERYMDWDNGLAWSPDGAWINKPDEGDIYGLTIGQIPYFNASGSSNPPGAAFFTPNRILPSPGMFGSLPTRVRASRASIDTPGSMRPWETLLFRPQANHPGAASPPDHLLMDLFWMPNVEPYAISEPFSTAGKVNLNYQIVPFTNIRRSTAMRAALKREKIAAVPTNAGLTYKNSATAPSYRFSLNLDETNGCLRQFEEKFSTGNIFKSGSEICDIYLVPDGQSWASNTQAETFWSNNKLTGENSRERPYANLYAKLTTRSNTYTVHCRVQLLKPFPSATAGQWDESKGAVLAEYRGSRQVERYIDPRNPALPDFANNPTAKVSDFDQLRLINDRRFSP